MTKVERQSKISGVTYNKQEESQLNWASESGFYLAFNLKPSVGKGVKSELGKAPSCRVPGLHAVCRELGAGQALLHALSFPIAPVAQA